MEHYLFVGLGNIGPRFAGTRHNVGRAALQAWVEAREESGIRNQELGIDTLFPDTGMNNSGLVVAEFVKKTSIPLDHIVVIHDDVELPLGDVRLTFGGSAKGHNGVRSIQAALGTSEFNRLRLGVGRPPEGVLLNDFVLERFLPEEQKIVEEMIGKAITILSSEVPRTNN